LKKLWYKVFFCKNCQPQSCKAFIGVTNGPQITVGERPLVAQTWNRNNRVRMKSATFDLF